MTANIAYKRVFLAISFMLLPIFSSCSSSSYAKEIPTPSIFIPPLLTNQPSSMDNLQPDPPNDTMIPLTPTSTEMLTPKPTSTPRPAFTPSWTMMAAGKLDVPILLYHHVYDANPTNRYIVSIQNFQSQLEELRNRGYTPIGISDLANVLSNGGLLPAHPVVITFDDGNADIYDNAFPIMKKMNFTGVLYIIADRLESPGFLNADQLKEMAAAGWEIGSHSETHVDLTRNHKIVDFEELQSRYDLEKAIGVPVKTFAYPYGLTDQFVRQSAEDCGYIAAVGLGISNEHTWSTLYFLSRREVRGSYDLDNFRSLLTLPTGQEPAPTSTPLATP
jgi:peptidoglycan/xylan/chitin deacetylase (PgdA/CDA1 family)